MKTGPVIFTGPVFMHGTLSKQPSGIADCHDKNLLFGFIDTKNDRIVFNKQLAVAFSRILSPTALRAAVRHILQRTNSALNFLCQMKGSFRRLQIFGDISEYFIQIPQSAAEQLNMILIQSVFSSAMPALSSHRRVSRPFGILPRPRK